MFHLTKWFSNFSGEATPTFSGEVHTLQSENLSKNNHTISILGTKGLSGDSLKKTAVFGSNAQINQTSISGSSSSKSSTTLTLGNNKKQSESYASRGKLELYGPNAYSTTLSYDDSESSFLSFPAAGTATSPAKLALLSEVTSVSNSLDELSSSVNTKLNGLTNLTTTHTNDISDINSTLNIFTTTYATKAELEAEITKLLDGASPDALDGIKELAAALNNDDEYYQTVNNLLSTKVNITDFNSSIGNLNDQKVNRSGDTMTGTLIAPRFESAITASDGKNINVYYHPTPYGNLYMALSQNNSVVNAMTLTPTYTRFNVPVEIYSGGTGANNAADARTNLGITPENIGAVNSTSGKATGSLGIINSSWPTLGFYLDKDTITGSVYQAQSSRRVGINQRAENSNFSEDYLFPVPSPVETEEDRPWYSILTSKEAVTIAQGGTGARDVATARANLGVVAKAGDTMTGALTVENNNITLNQGTAQKGFVAIRTIDNIEHKTDYMMSSAGGPIIRYIIDGSEKNRMTLREEETAFHKPVNISSGGTGADSAAKARENLGAVSKSGDTITGILYRQGGAGAIGLAIGTASKPENVSIISVGDGTTSNRFAFRQYGINGNRENFNLPDTVEPAKSINYDILTSKNAVTIAQGGTGATTRPGAVESLMFLGNNPINTPSKDTITNWRTQGTGYAWYTTTGQINNQPSQWGVLINYSLGANDAFQLWGTAAGAVYHRSGNQNADLTVHTWRKFFDDSMTIPVANGGTGATTADGACQNIGAVKKSGDTMTGTLTLHTTGLKTSHSAGYTTNQYGNFVHQSTTANDTWGICSNSGAANFKVAYETGNTTISGSAYIKKAIINDAYPSILFATTSRTGVEHAFIQMNATNSQLGFYSYATDQDANSTKYYEGYYLPVPNSGMTAKKTYPILTGKSPVTIAQGGTGLTNAKDVQSFFMNSFNTTSGVDVSTMDVFSLPPGIYHHESETSTANHYPIAATRALVEVKGQYRTGTSAADGYPNGYWSIRVYYPYSGEEYWNHRTWSSWTGWKKSYNSAYIVYSTSQPTYAAGRIWLKPV